MAELARDLLFTRTSLNIEEFWPTLPLIEVQVQLLLTNNSIEVFTSLTLVGDKAKKNAAE